MSIKIDDLDRSALELEIDGKLDIADYRQFVPIAEKRIRENGQVSLLIHISKLSGWTPSALWEDLRFDAKHFDDVSRLALVAQSDSKKWLATISRPFTAAKVSFYTENNLDKARSWVMGV
jgi:hypothetical protein